MTWQDNVRNAKERIVLASLYLGTGNKEQQLVSKLCDIGNIDQPINQSVEQPTYQFINLQYIWFVKLTSSPQYQSIIRQNN